MCCIAYIVIDRLGYSGGIYIETWGCVCVCVYYATVRAVTAVHIILFGGKKILCIRLIFDLCAIFDILR